MRDDLGWFRGFRGSPLTVKIVLVYTSAMLAGARDSPSRADRCTVFVRIIPNSQRTIICTMVDGHASLLVDVAPV